MNSAGRLPLPVRAVFLGLLVGAGALVWGLINDDDGNLTGELAGAAFAAPVAAVMAGLFLWRQEHRLFDVGGRPATPDEQAAVLRALRAGHWPAEERLHPVADRILDLRLRQSGKPAFSIAVFAVMVAVTLVNVWLNGPWWWFGVAFWLVVGPWAVLSSRRERARALALKEARPGRSLDL